MSKKKHKKHKIKYTKPGYTNLAPLSTNVKIEIAAIEDDHSVHIKMSGFGDFDDVIDYSEFLATYLPLLLYKTEIVQ